MNSEILSNDSNNSPIFNFSMRDFCCFKFASRRISVKEKSLHDPTENYYKVYGSDGYGIANKWFQPTRAEFKNK